MFIGIAGTIPNLPNLPGQGGGGGVEVLLEYDSSSFCKVTNPNLILPTVAEPAGGTFSYTGTGTLGIVPNSGLINVFESDSGSYTITYSVGGSSSSFPIAIGNEIILSITTSPGATICTGDTATLTANASGGSGGFTYSWDTSPVQTAQSIDVTTSGNYTVTVMDSDGCSVSAVQQITASTNATTIASINNNAAMSFNGTDSYIQMGENLPNLSNTARTLVFWAKAADWTSLSVIIESNKFKMTVVSGYSGYMVFTTNSEVDNDQRKTWPTTSLANNTWHHFAMTVDSSNDISNIYVDGVSESTTSVAGFNTGTVDNIGKRWNNSSYFEGELDEIAVWDSKLSSCDIKGIYEGSIGSNAGKAANLLDANTTIPAPVYWNRMGDS
jgi:hypothetical protein